MVIVTGSVHGRPDTISELETLSLAHVLRSRQEPGCLLHSVQRDIEDPLHLVFFEQWLDADALRAHFKVRASREFATRARALADQAPQIVMFAADVASL